MSEENTVMRIPTTEYQRKLAEKWKHRKVRITVEVRCGPSESFKRTVSLPAMTALTAYFILASSVMRDFDEALRLSGAKRTIRE